MRLAILGVLLLSGCSNIQYQGMSFDSIDQHPISIYETTGTTFLSHVRPPANSAGALNFTWTFDWPLGSKLPGEK